jgi:hypothetical protein
MHLLDHIHTEPKSGNQVEQVPIETSTNIVFILYLDLYVLINIHIIVGLCITSIGIV